MKTVDYSDCKTVFSLQFSKDAPSEGPVEPTKPRVPVWCWRGQVPAAALPPLNPPGCGFPARSQALGVFRNSSCAAPAAGTGSNSGTRWPGERRHARSRGGSEAGDIGGDTAGLLLRGPPALSRGSGGLARLPRAGPGVSPGSFFFHQRRCRSGGRNC